MLFALSARCVCVAVSVSVRLYIVFAINALSRLATCQAVELVEID